jgi:hypothetical protein
MTHHIRLGPPWEVTAIGGRLRHVRRFGRPRTIGPGERVWLVALLAGGSEARLNGVTLEWDGPFAADVTDSLLQRNEVEFLVPADAAAPADVALEIRSSE